MATYDSGAPDGALDLDDVSGCPLGIRCESCGTEHGRHAVAARETALGVMCLTLCPPCRRAGTPPPVAVATAARLVAQHLEHCITGRGAVVEVRPDPAGPSS